MDLIDRKAIAEHLRKIMDMQDLYLPIHIIQLIDELPTIEAEPVVHCKDCRYASTLLVPDKIVCVYFDDAIYGMKENDFCSRAERKADGT